MTVLAGHSARAIPQQRPAWGRRLSFGRQPEMGLSRQQVLPRAALWHCARHSAARASTRPGPTALGGRAAPARGHWPLCLGARPRHHDCRLRRRHLGVLSSMLPLTPHYEQQCRTKRNARPDAKWLTRGCYSGLYSGLRVCMPHASALILAIGASMPWSRPMRARTADESTVSKLDIDAHFKLQARIGAGVCTHARARSRAFVSLCACVVLSCVCVREGGGSLCGTGWAGCVSCMCVRVCVRGGWWVGKREGP